MSDTEKPQITQMNADGSASLAGAGFSSLDSGSHEWLRTVADGVEVWPVRHFCEALAEDRLWP